MARRGRGRHLRSGPTAKLQVVTPDTTVRTILVAAEYNARGQQTHAELGNGVEVTSAYDDETFRLYRRHAFLGSDTYQDLRHHYGDLMFQIDASVPWQSWLARLRGSIVGAWNAGVFNNVTVTLVASLGNVLFHGRLF